MANRLRERLAATGAELARLAERVRALIGATVSAEATAPALLAAADGVERALAALDPFLPASHPPRYPEAGELTSPNDLMPYDPVMGRMSPLAPPIEFCWEEGKAVGRVTFGTPYEGPPGCVHGGVLAAAFDTVFNVANVMSGTAGPTAKLTLRYRRPTPLRAPLVFEGWIERSEGRRVHTRGRLLHDGVVTVEAEGLFVRVPVERVMRLLGRS